MLERRWKDLSNKLPEKVQLLAVSKGQQESSIRRLVELGHRDFGESRLQEALPKIKALVEIPDIRWHFIGRLQSNKVRAVIRSFSVIQSLDSEALALRVSKIAGEEKRCPEVMMQVKLRDDPKKGGFEITDLIEAWPRLLQLPNVKTIGLMTMSPKVLNSKQRKELFKECRELADRLGLQECSMGMSNDWKEAVDAGATWVRLGSTLFGDRAIN